MPSPEGLSTAPGFVGRADELTQLDSALSSARAGQGRALVITGDAGVGKTRLVQRAASLAADFLVLTGTCLPLASISVPLLPLRTAVSTRPGASGRPELRTVSGAEAAEELDRWLEDRCEEQPVALVVDDLQWADQGTLDVLMWVVAGLSRRRLAVLCTLRRGEVGPGHPLVRWLADVRRLPGFDQISLAPLELEETREQISHLLGEVPHDTLVREVHERTGGNAYLNQLLVREVPASAAALGHDLPEDLTAAVLRSWHQLSPGARQLSRVIAVSGRVARGRSLEDAARLAAVGDPGPLLRECVEQGVLDTQEGDGYWFHHPLQAEALEAGLSSPERLSLHAAFAGALERDLDASAPDLAALVLVSDHRLRAGEPEAALSAAGRAAAAAEREGAWGEVVRQLHRAVDVMAQSRGSADEAAPLWWRIRTAAERAGELVAELEATETLLGQARLDRLSAAELLVRREHLRFMTGRGFFDREALAEAARLSAVNPASWQHAFALAEGAHVSLWANDPSARELADDALTRARASQHPRALSYALTAAAMSAVYDDRVADARALAGEAVACAVEAADGFAFGHASLWEANAIGSNADPRWGASVAARRQQLSELDLPHTYLAWLATGEAQSTLFRGNWRECQTLLRLALGRSPGALVDVSARLLAAHLAALQGRVHEAEGHLARADELFAETSTFLPFEFDAVRAMVRLAAGDARGCVAAALVGTSNPGVPPTMAEWLMPLASRGLADLADECRDAGDDVAPLLAEVDDLERRFPHAIQDAGGEEFYYRMLEALDALYAAERARARHSADRTHSWAVAAEQLHGKLPWDECYALLRLAQSLFLTDPARRADAVDALRRCHALARELEAVPVLEEVAALARTARVPLDEPATPLDATEPAHDRLTAREREVLAHIVAGRTYGEIARALVLSEKTVSSHVSHLLAKTGTANRVDLARWATRRPPA